MVSIPGYQITEEIYNGSRTVVYRGYRESDSLRVVIKLLENPYPSFTELMQFHNQYTIAKNLSFPGIIQTYSLETYQNGYALVMEDFGGISLKQWGTVPTLIEFLLLAIALCNILDILIRHRIIHKDIKPANILINPETHDVKLIDFSIASLLPRETQTLKNPDVLEGTLSYLSPEQTGRMNRGIDYRTDFYSLGVTFYELLTGQLPFQSNDPMELIHSHIAKLPCLVHEINPEIAPILSEIVSKLMAKNAEDRYQSAFGLKYDLEACLHQLQQTGKIESFPIGQRDISDHFIIPEKLYGREEEVKTLLEAFDRVTKHQTELMLVAGFSGIGKTAIINEVHKPIAEQRGYFIKGKFDQFNRNIPFSAFVQTFRDLMEQLRRENDIQLSVWKTKILAALGENGQVIIEVIPELEQIIGQQVPVPNLSGNAAQNRFNLLFQKFIQVFTTKEHPLVIFLDDLQWADSASLKLMQLLMDDSMMGHLLLIGAYRDHEVSTAHPLMLTLGEIGKAKVTINIITLAPLSTASLNQLVADTLRCSLEVVQPLTQLVYQKTKGNPFFSTQFLKALHEDGLIQFDFAGGNWQCDIPQVKALALTDDVVEFMALQLQKLPTATQDVLKLAACIGNEFDLATLAIVQGARSTDLSPISEAQTATAIWKALQEGLILPQTEVYKFYVGQENQTIAGQSSQAVTYKFLHDRVQQAAYFLIPEDEKQATHLKLGQLLLNNIPVNEQEEKIFQIVSQLNMGLGLITQQTERNQLAQLNLVAGRKAKASTAYTAAVQYLTLGIELLAADSWQNQYVLMLALYEEAAEAEYLNTQFEEAITLIDVILQQTTHLVDRIKAYELKVQIYIAQDQQVQAIETGLKALEQLKISLILPDVEQENYLEQLPELTSLANIPEMSNPESLAALRLLISITPAVHHVKPEMFPSIALTMLHLCLEQGHSSLAAYVYGIYGLFLCAVIKDVDTAYHSGQISLKLLEQYHAKELSSKIYMLFGVFICTCKEHGRNTLQLLREAMQCGLEVGDIEYASYSMMAESAHLFLIGEPLNSVGERQAKYIDLLLNFKQKHCVDYANIWRQLTLNLLGESSEQFYLTGIDFDETQMLLHFHNTHNHQSLFAAYVAKTVIFYTFESYEQAVTNAEQATEFVDGAFGLLLVAAHNFYYSLSLLARYSNCSRPAYPEEADANHQELWLKQVFTNQKLIRYWADHAEANFQHKYDLVEAEAARVMGNTLKAIEYYDRAIAGAKKNGYLNEEALSNELAAKFYLKWGKQNIAREYITNAYYGYARWGALAKIADLEKRYPQLLAPILQQTRPSFSTKETLFAGGITSTSSLTFNSSSISVALDLTAILKASQTISGEIEMEKLLSSLLSIVIENAGADKCVLMLVESDKLLIRALAKLVPQNNGNTKVDFSSMLTNPQPVEESKDLPVGLINTVKRNFQPSVIVDASVHPQLTNDPYIGQQQPKSILCSPILHQAKLLGVLYLENKLAAGAFTQERVELLNLLCAQAAISIENARLYQREQEKSLELETALQNLQQAQLQIVQSEKMSALGNLVAGVAHEMNNPLGFIAASLKLAKPTFADLIEHLKLYEQRFPTPGDEILIHAETIDLEYNLKDFTKMIDSMTMACDRLKNISTSLRTFSRADRDYKVPFNIHEGIDSTILILKHRLKANDSRPAIEVVTNYGNLPQVECFPGQLNQVFMNILANAIDALDESNTGLTFQEIKANLNRITITTVLKEKQVEVTIADNGQGMSESVKQKVFDHLFTTKSVGKGTGLGLAIAGSIVVEKHGGTLDVNSIPGVGTEFLISLPILAQIQN
ncbi:AAA family ATPase [Nostoc sp. UCD121]|uniref:ATP-binding sensor histidine kinase n=1 Tax=unclassified Nostoc TaxID=2593658 RepID=UPI00162AD17B|nr:MULTISPECIES: ATP-binding sensor histidine kinase [unclassified Nostoc]MBC1225032.1 AAA family ATPase [Nostoc sp. UCD120]MBC1277944.1 AAA family ATPase [Nostoc sp. UCD121]MBC1298669.1 AAA family ATPase [Nostoc sp. UCD122]